MNASNQEIVLSMQDMNNKSIRQAMVQSPFILQLELNNKNFMHQKVSYISGMDNFKYSPAMRHSQSFEVDGKTIYKIIYKFVLKGEKKGIYTVGPLLLKDRAGKTFRSNKLIIKVDDELVLSEQPEAPKYIVQGSFEKKTVYIGEITTLQLRFLDRIFVDDPKVDIPEFENIKILNIEKKETSTIELINGYDYAVTEWLITFYPINHGNLSLQGIKIKFMDQRLEDVNLNKGAFRRFGSMMKIGQDVDADVFDLQVLSLPKIDIHQQITAVGQFSKLGISVNKYSIKEGQGLLLSTELIGDGNFEMIEPINLNLPTSLQSYDADMITINRDIKSKYSEFIIQAQEPGFYHLEAQQLHYFDPHDETYKILESNSIDINITPNVELNQKKNQINKKNNIDNDLHDISQDVNQRKYNILKYNIFLKNLPMMLPIIWYRYSLFFLLFILLMMVIYQYAMSSYISTNASWQNFILFLKAKKSCKVAAYKNNVVVLYSIFLNLFIDLHVGSIREINKEMIDNFLKTKGFSDSQMIEWNLFYARLLQASFAQQDAIQHTSLFQDSLMWLQQLKDKI